jgi:membrane protease YdiL (CAAX protease family)
VITNEPSPLPNDPVVTPEAQSEISAPQPTLRPGRDRWTDLIKAFGAWIGSIGFLLFVPLAFILPYFIYLAVSKRMPSGEAIAQDKTFLLLSIVAVIPAHLLTLLLAWVLVTNWRRRPFAQTLGLSWPPGISTWKAVSICFLVGILLLGVGVLITNLFGGGKTDLDRLIESSYQARIATAIVAILTAPIVEEIIYRGMLYSALEKVTGVAWAIAIVSILFAGVHVLQYKNNIGVILAITILSLTLTVVRAYTGKLLPPVLIHLVFNGLQSLYLILEPYISKPQNVQPAPALIELYRSIHHVLF